MKKLLTFFVNRFIKPFVIRYTSKTTVYSYAGADIVVFPGVFHPRFFFSTKLLLGTIKKMDLRKKSFLELGAGSGLISVVAAMKGAIVTASDISAIAVDNVRENSKKNKLAFTIIQSDLFEAIPRQTFGIIVINPPYYKKKPVSEADHAWYCGENAEYFDKLFSSLGSYLQSDSQVLMVLADVCDVDLIKAIALRHYFIFSLISEHELLLEKNFIFRILPSLGK